MIDSYLSFLERFGSEFIVRLLEHIEIVLLAVAIAIPIGVGTGILIRYNDVAATVVLWLAGIAQTVPSLALFGLLIPIVGIGYPPVVIALVMYAQLPIMRNTYIGLSEVPEASNEVAAGIGMTPFQRLRRVQLPIALPVIMAGIRNATVIMVGIAAIGAFIGAGGLGQPIFRGIRLPDTQMIVVASILVATLALVLDYLLGSLEQYFQLSNGEDVDPNVALRFTRSTLTPLVQKLQP